jgi:outer membrane receptor protein involved in Fe transport
MRHCLKNYKWYDYFFFIQDTWQLNRSFTLNYGLRYEAPGTAVASLYGVSDAIQNNLGGYPVFSMQPRPDRPTKNFQPRVGLAWNPHTSTGGWLGRVTGGDKLVLRGGYSHTNDYAFINIALNIASAFPFVGAVSMGRRNTKLEVYLQESQELKSFARLNQAEHYPG